MAKRKRTAVYGLPLFSNEEMTQRILRLYCNNLTGDEEFFMRRIIDLLAPVYDKKSDKQESTNVESYKERMHEVASFLLYLLEDKYNLTWRRNT